MEKHIKKTLEHIEKGLGFGHTEAVYKEALAMELQEMGYKVKQEVSMPIIYKDVQIGTCRCDIFCRNTDSQYIIELKNLTSIRLYVRDQVRKYSGLFKEKIDKRGYVKLINSNMRYSIKTPDEPKTKYS